MTDALNKGDAVGVAGAGAMGAGIAQVAAGYGHAVRLYDARSETVDAAIAGIRRALDKRVEGGRIGRAEADALLARISPCSELDGFAGCALVVEAVTEDLQVKHQLLRRLEEICGDGVILASNTSSLSITALGAGLARPHNLAGMHFFNPAPVMKLVEVISGLATATATARRLFATAAAWGKTPVHAKNSPGFIVNRVARAYYAEPLRLLQEGVAGIATVDALFRDGGGFPLGPFELMDFIGNDVNYAVTESVFRAFHQDPRYRPSLLQQELVAGGRLGRKSGSGWYDYGGAAAEPRVETSVSDFRPAAIRVRGELGAAAALPALAAAAGVDVRMDAGETGASGKGEILVGDASLALTDGRTATARSKEEGGNEDEAVSGLVLFDLLADYADNQHIALTVARQAPASALHHAVGFFNALGKRVSVLDDAPGLCVMRTVCMLANEGADAVLHGICDAASVDDAMRHGMRHPRGPLRWAEKIGLGHARAVLDNLRRSYGGERYRASLLINRMVDAGESFYPEKNA